MNKKISKHIALIFALCIIIAPNYLYAASRDNSIYSNENNKHPKTIHRDIYYEMNNKNDLTYDAPEIKFKGKTYKAVDVNCEFYSFPISKTQRITSTNKKVPLYITKNINGQEIKLYAPKKINWKKCIPYQKEFGIDENIPASIERNGRKMFKFGEPKLCYKTEKVAAPAIFCTKEPYSNYYMFNGKIVLLQDGEPKWDGYKSDYADYLGVAKNNDYSITGSYWKNNFTKKNGTYYRTAMVTGTKVVSYYLQNYSYSSKGLAYLANVKFTSKMIGVAHITYTLKWPIIKIIIYACLGIGILALLIAAILGVFKKKRQLTDADVISKELYNLEPLEDDNVDSKDKEEDPYYKL